MTGRPRIAQWLLERIALGEVPKRHRESVEGVRGSEEVRAELRSLETSGESLMERIPPDRFAAEVLRRQAREAQKRERAPRRWVAMAFVPLVAVLCVVALRPTEPAGERLKGLSPHLVVYRRNGADMERLTARAVAHAGDQLQLRYVAATARQGFVFSVDGAGQVTVHWPLGQSTSMELDPTAEVTLPSSYQLDAAPRFERFFFVTADRPFEVETVLAAARALASQSDGSTAPLALPTGLSEFSFVLEKQP